jgi:putative spermidine/putrescine transport system ATP-binding protein
MLAKVGLSGLEHRSAAGLSGGERQRVAVARALVLEPDAILLDEPLTHLDVGLRRELIALFRVLFEERRVTVLYVTHDPREAVTLGDRLVVLDAGEVAQCGSLEELRANPASKFVKDLVEEFDWRAPR